MSMKVKHKRPESFYDNFDRKDNNQKNTHYCPGCGHGTAHKLIAETIDDLGIKDNVVFCSPVGCSVFAYYYFDTGNVQCSHGRAPAVATGIRRTLDDSIIISYQGDGDLAGIGMGAIVHAANRGENMTVFFVNNAIYGMTGGQMAPTTLIGQKTLTTPEGRVPANDGYPIGMSELINSLNAPVFIERVSLGDAGRVLKARKAIRKALESQVARKGFSFVEILSPCPINWKMSPVEARKWLIENLEPAYPVKNFRDNIADTKPYAEAPLYEPDDKELEDLFANDRGDELDNITQRTGELKDQYVKISGFGGQGVMSVGVLLANCALAEGVNATWLPSYGPEMRGGTANASVIVSKDAIGAPVVETPNVLIAMNGPSLDAFEDKMQKNGLIIVNSSIVSRKVERNDLRVIYAPLSDIAKDAGAIMTANIVALALYAKASNAIEIDTIKKVLPVSIKRKNLVETNLNAIDAGVAFYNKNYPQGV